GLTTDGALGPPTAASAAGAARNAHDAMATAKADNLVGHLSGRHHAAGNDPTHQDPFGHYLHPTHLGLGLAVTRITRPSGCPPPLIMVFAASQFLAGTSSRMRYCSAALFTPTATMVRPLAFLSWHSRAM